MRGMLQNVVLAIAVVGTIVMIAKKVDAVARHRGGRGTESPLVAAALRCTGCTEGRGTLARCAFET